MEDVRLGSALRALRLRQGLSQADVARRARVSRACIIKIEQGQVGGQRLDLTRAVATALGARLDIQPHLPGGDLDRVINADHAVMHEGLAAHLAGIDGWTWRPEVTFSIYGERGVIDLLAWHNQSRCLLIIELKTRLVDPQELAGVMDRRRRLGPRIAADLGWDVRAVSTWVVIGRTSTNRRRVAAHAGLLRAAFPSDGRSMRRWLGRPEGRIDALSFWSTPSTLSGSSKLQRP